MGGLHAGLCVYACGFVHGPAYGVCACLGEQTCVWASVSGLPARIQVYAYMLRT